MFAGWSRGCIGAVATCRLAVDRGITARAHFERNPALVTVTVGGPGLVVSTPPGIACGAGGRACTATFGDGAKVTFAAHSKPEAILDSWGDDCMHATGDVCEVTIESRGEISATFRREVAEPGDQSVFTQVENGAGLQSSPPGIACPPTCGTTFPSGTRVRLSGGSSYSWEGDCVGSGGACVVVSDTSIGIKAIRLPPGPPPGSSTAFVNVTVSGGGVVRGGSIECDSRGRFAGCQAPFRRGSAVVLHAIAHKGYRFAGWGGFCSYRKLKPRCRLQLSTRKTAIAVFKR